MKICLSWESFFEISWRHTICNWINIKGWYPICGNRSKWCHRMPHAFPYIIKPRTWTLEADFFSKIKIFRKLIADEYFSNMVIGHTIKVRWSTTTSIFLKFNISLYFPSPSKGGSRSILESTLPTFYWYHWIDLKIMSSQKIVSNGHPNRKLSSF